MKRDLWMLLSFTALTLALICGITLSNDESRGLQKGQFKLR